MGLRLRLMNDASPLKEDWWKWKVWVDGTRAATLTSVEDNGTAKEVAGELKNCADFPRRRRPLYRAIRSCNRILLARLTTRMRTLAVCLVALQLLPAFAWVFPEHRDMVVLGVQKLKPDQRAQLEKLWQEARSGHENRLCASVADPAAEGAKPTCVDYAAWAAISGDHSCSARDMLTTVLDAPWVLGVERVSAKLKNQLANAKRRDQRVNALKDSDISLERTDPEYATRATSNNAHFLMARSDVAMEPAAYARLALGTSADLNALATYLWYHLRALAAAGRLGNQGDGEARSQTVRAVLADEAFAIHFLEDSFAAGHVAGNWGNSAVRLGTHDYYNEHGIPLNTWSGHPFVASGDAYLRAEDADRASNAVRDSLIELLDAFNGNLKITGLDPSQLVQPESFDVCHAQHFPAMAGTSDEIRMVVPVVEQMPVPALGAGLGALPRFRAELGPFVGLSTAVRGGVLTRGFGSTQTDLSTIGGVEAAFRVGVGLEGVLNESSDGLAFAEIGVREDRHASGTATLPGRGALAMRLRMPYWLVPGDLLIGVPALAFTSSRTLMKMAVGAANGGLIPWQAGIATRYGRFQFILGREAGLSWYRNNSDHPILIPTPRVPPVDITLVTLNSFQVELPIFEYRAFRTFSLNQSSALNIQPYLGLDFPTKSGVFSPTGAPNPHLHTITTAGIRVVFDWRHYLQGK